MMRDRVRHMPWRVANRIRVIAMRIQGFSIENFRNIRLAECWDLPDFVVICGGNGCGKTSLLEALWATRTNDVSAATDPKVVAADAAGATVSVRFAFDSRERAFARERHGIECPEVAEVV